MRPNARNNQLGLTLILATSASACPGETVSPVPGTGGTGGESGECTPERRLEDTRSPPPIATPRWVYRPWIGQDISGTSETHEIVETFLFYDLPLGVIVFDGPWATNYNTFVPSERFVGLQAQVDRLRDIDIRSVLWTSGMINVQSVDLELEGAKYGPSPDWEPALTCGYFVNDGETYAWAKGSGSPIDFFNPDARAHWHRLLDPVFDWGVAGFQLEPAERHIAEPILTSTGAKTREEYSRAYYEDFYAYGSARAPEGEFVTVVPAYVGDDGGPAAGYYARPEHAPVVSVRGTGHDEEGFRRAVDHVFRAAEAGHVVVGAEIGGFIPQSAAAPAEIDPELLMRWYAFGAMLPLMYLYLPPGFAPWTLPPDPATATQSFRYWGKVHEALIPFFDGVARELRAGGNVPMIQPLADPSRWADDPRYMLGGALLVVPVVTAAGSMTIEIPDDGRYFDLFDPFGTPIAGGSLLERDVSDPLRLPVFAREGAIVPLEVEDEVTGFGTEASAGALTLLVYPAPGSTHHTVWTQGGLVETEVSAESQRDGTVIISLSERPRTVIMRVRLEGPPSEARFDGRALSQQVTRATFDLADAGWFVDGGFVWVKIPVGEDGGEARIVAR